MQLTETKKLLQSTGVRLHLARIAGAAYVAFWIVAAAYFVLLVTARATGLLPDALLQPVVLLAVPGLAFMFGVLFHRRPSAQDAAREVDRHRGTRDLFLTADLLDGSPGEFKTLVAQQAERTAPTVNPRDVVPFGSRLSQSRLAKSAGFLAALWLAMLVVPQFDPFGKVAAANENKERIGELVKSRKETRVRTAQVRRELSEDKQDKDVDKAIEDLKGAFDKAKPQQKQANIQKLKAEQAQMDKLWRMNAEKLKELLAQKSTSQQFGDAVSRMNMQKWSEDLKQGSTKSMQEELGELQEQLETLKKATDPVERSEAAQELKKRLQELSNFAEDRVGSEALSRALKRALNQLQMSKTEGMSEEAMQALNETLELSKLELQEIAQSAEQLKKLEESLRALQLAKRLNEMEQLDGGKCEGCQSISDYAELYAKMMAELAGQETGPGMGGPGIGEGGEAPEDNTVSTGFKSEQSKSTITAGKVLLSLKTRGLGEENEGREEFREAVRQVKQGVSEAILQEQIPPGYHEGIKRYFDAIDEGK